MEARDLLLKFEGRTDLPIDVNEVLNVLRSNGYDDDVEFVGADLDADILQGAIKIWYDRALPYADPRRMVNVYYHRGHPKDWQRMICCKELLHMLDPDWALTSDIEAVDRLADEIGLPPEMQNPMKDQPETNVDRIAEMRAAAILLPWAARNVMLPYYEAGTLTLDDIARQADIPRKFAGLVMHSAWPSIYSWMARGKAFDETSDLAAE